MSGEGLTLRGVVKREGGYWASIVLDYNIVGTGDTPEDAVATSVWMTKAYVEEGCAAGRDLKSLKRATPARAKADYYLASILSHLPARHSGGCDARSFHRQLSLAAR